MHKAKLFSLLFLLMMGAASSAFQAAGDSLIEDSGSDISISEDQSADLLSDPGALIHSSDLLSDPDALIQSRSKETEGTQSRPKETKGTQNRPKETKGTQSRPKETKGTQNRPKETEGTQSYSKKTKNTTPKSSETGSVGKNTSRRNRTQFPEKMTERTEDTAASGKMTESTEGTVLSEKMTESTEETMTSGNMTERTKETVPSGKMTESAEETETSGKMTESTEETETYGNMTESAEETQSEASGTFDEQIAREYRWLEKHADEFPSHKIEYAENNPGLIDFLYRYAFGEKESSSEESGDRGLTEDEKKTYAPVLLQWDDRWGFHPYGTSVLGLTGCGPTCLAMVVDSLSEDADVTPAEAADFATKQDLYEYGVGTRWGIWSAGATEYGLECETVSADFDTVLGELSQNAMVVCSVGPGVFTPGGHFIVIVGQEEGKLEIRDPNNFQNSTRLWDWDEFSSQIKHCWSFKGKSSK